MGEFLIHYLCQYQTYYLKYALLSAHSLIHKGGLDPQQIVFTIDPPTAASPWNSGIDYLGCRRQILPAPGPHKLVCVDRLFKTSPEIDTILQMDSDTYLAQSFSIRDWVEGLSQHDVGCYPMSGCRPAHIFIDRSSKLNYSALRYKPGQYSVERFHRCLKLMCHVDHKEFYPWLSDEKRVWPWGTLILLRRHLLGTPFWETAINFDLIGSCDESALMLGTFRDPSIPIHLFDPDPLPQMVVNKDLCGAIAHGRGLLHYAGPHGKEGSRLDIEKLVSELFPDLPSDTSGSG
jgi:hypothetical protein